WKALHMLVYLAYVAVVAHVGLGLLQDERHPFFLGVVAIGAVVTLGLHLAAGLREAPADRLRPAEGRWVDAGPAATIPEGRARVAMAGTERVAIFRHEGRLSCVS